MPLLQLSLVRSLYVFLSLALIVTLFVLLMFVRFTREWFIMVKKLEMVIYATMMLQVVELACFLLDGFPGGIGHVVVLTVNTIRFLACLLPLSLWFFYMDHLLIRRLLESKTRKIRHPRVCHHRMQKVRSRFSDWFL